MRPAWGGARPHDADVRELRVRRVGGDGGLVSSEARSRMRATADGTSWGRGGDEGRKGAPVAATPTKAPGAGDGVVTRGAIGRTVVTVEELAPEAVVSEVHCLCGRRRCRERHLRKYTTIGQRWGAANSLAGFRLARRQRQLRTKKGIAMGNTVRPLSTLIASPAAAAEALRLPHGSYRPLPEQSLPPPPPPAPCREGEDTCG